MHLCRQCKKNALASTIAKHTATRRAQSHAVTVAADGQVAPPPGTSAAERLVAHSFTEPGSTFATNLQRPARHLGTPVRQHPPDRCLEANKPMEIEQTTRQ